MFLWGTATAAYQIEGAVKEDGRGPVRLGHLRPRAGPYPRRAHRGRGLRPLPPVGRGRGAHGATWASTPTASRSPGPGCSRRHGRGQPEGAGLLRPAGRRAAGGGDRAGAHAVPLGPAAGAAGPRRVAEPRHRPPLRRLRGDSGRAPRRPGADVDHAQRAVRAHGLRVRAWASTPPARPCCSTPCPSPTTNCSATAWPCRRCARPAREQVLITNNCTPVWPASESAQDLAAADAYDILHNRLFNDPILLGDVSGPDGRTAPSTTASATATWPSSPRPWTAWASTTTTPPGSARPPTTACPSPIAGITGVPHDRLRLAGRPRRPARTPDGPARQVRRRAAADVHHRERLLPADDVPGPDGTIDDQGRIAFLDGHIQGDRAGGGGGRRRARLLRLVAAGQLRVGRGLPPALRPGPRGLRDAAPHPQGVLRLAARSPDHGNASEP